LTGLGSAAPATDESFVTSTRATYRGRAIAIVRGADEDGEIVIHATSERHGDATLTLHATGHDDIAASAVATATRGESA
jgi:hypothetical protein